MPYSKLISGVFVALTLAVTSPALAIFAVRWDPAPLSRLIRNLEARVKANFKDAEAAYTLGRLHALGFVRGDVPVNYVSDHTAKSGFYPHDRIREVRRSKRAPSPATLAHLRESIRGYSAAVELKPKEGLYQLGLGWMLQQGAEYADTVDWPLGAPGEKRSRIQWVRAAAKSLTIAFDLSEKSDLSKNFGWGGEDWAVSLEAGESLLKLYETDLAQDKDVAERRKRLDETVKALKSKPSRITPIVFPLDRKSGLASLVDSSKRIRFDLTGDNHPERWPWPNPNAALLVWDPLQSGRIISGRQLFGSRTWQMVWQHGYQPLTALDDDRNGWLTGREMAGIAAWTDRNGNGVSEPGGRSGVETGYHRHCGEAGAARVGSLATSRGLTILGRRHRADV
jgi:hypothetical protein